MYNIKLTLAYDGTEFLGWQKTSTGPSIENELQKVLQLILQEEITLQAASRTDAGVHAAGQIVNFFTHKAITDLQKLCLSLNKLLPKAIVVLEASAMHPTFHPTLNNKGKEYHYHLCLGKVQLPQHRFFSWHCPYYLNVDEMRASATQFLGKQDFASLCNTKKNECYSDTIRELTRVDIIALPENRLRIEIEGNHFLYKMARNIVGTLVYIGNGKIPASDLSSILKGNDRTQAGVTAPAHGLSLHKISVSM